MATDNTNTNTTSTTSTTTTAAITSDNNNTMDSQEEQTSPEQPIWQVPFFSQTTEEMARAVVAAAAAVRPRPSIVFSSNYDGGNKTFKKWQRQFSRLWKQGSLHEGNKKAFFNPEHLTKQKRQWTQLQLRSLEKKLPKEPPCLFEHMILIGFHPKMDLETTRAALIKRRAVEREVDSSDLLRDVMRHHGRGAVAPKLEPEVLFIYPPGKRLPMRLEDLPAFCFPSGLEVHLRERTPSLSELNEVVYGQDHMNRDDLSYIFSLKVADNATLYGVCVCVPQLVEQAPGIMSGSTDDNLLHTPLSKYSLSSYRCYCILTKFPFFSLHFGLLNSIIMQERLERITRSVEEMTSDLQHDDMAEAHSQTNGVDLSLEKDEPETNGDNGLHKHIVENHLQKDAYITSDILKSPDSDDTEANIHDYAMQKTSQSNGHASVETQILEKNLVEERVGGDNFDESQQTPLKPRHERYDSSESISSIFEGFNRIANSEDDSEFEDVASSGHEYLKGLDSILSWAEANDNQALQIVCKYRQIPVPARGSSVCFRPLEHLQPLSFTRSGQVSASLIGGRTLDSGSCKTNLEDVEVQAALSAAEEANSLSIWTVATVCRVLSLENVLTLFAAALLEKQVVVICPNLGVLSAVVLSIIPLIRPFQWQSLLMPVLPNKMMDFLDAPVPFIVGVQSKSSAFKSKASNVVTINVQKNKVIASSFPQLPRMKELASALEPYHSKLIEEYDFAKKHPVYEYNDAQAYAVEGFLAVLRSYLECLCKNLQLHTITNVQSNNDKVSLLLKDSFVEDFSSRDRPFMKLFVDTQLFSVHTDAVLSFFESD